jgi:hypothetical protein
MSDFPFEIGQIYNRKQIGGLLYTQDANIRNGVFRPRGTNDVLLFVTEERVDRRAPSYHDRLFGNKLVWYGQMSGRTDSLIINSSEWSLKLHLFYRKSKTQFKEFSRFGFLYLGPVSYVRHEGSHPTVFRLKVEEIVDDSERPSEVETFREGNPVEMTRSFFERNSRAREEAIKIHGLMCMVCGFNFEEVYGHWGIGYIEVHHVLPLSHTRNEREVNPRTDLVVLCSNCHKMIHHFRSNILTPDRLKEMIDRRRGTSLG